jgi:hypothetical protein
MARKSTMIHLVQELEKLPKSPDIDFMIKEAKTGEYHDYKNQKYVCGKMESSQRLRSLGYPDLAYRIEQGEFDEPADDLDKQTMRNELGQGAQANALKEILGL